MINLGMINLTSNKMKREATADYAEIYAIL